MTPVPATVAGGTDPDSVVFLVGCGSISRSHAAAINATDGLRLGAVIDPQPEALARAVDELGVPGFDSVEAALHCSIAHVACICTPPATHRSLAEALLESGVDVLCEKPLATSAAEARAMLETADREGRKLAVSDKFRHVPDLESAAGFVRQGAIGVPLSYAVTFCAPVDVRGRWPSNPELSGGGVIMDNAPHAFDVLSHVLNDPIADLKACLAEPVLSPQVEDTALIIFRTESGAIGQVELSWVYFSRDLDYLVVQGSEGTLCVGWDGGRIRRHGEREWDAFGSGYEKAEAFRGVWNAFRNPAEDGRRWPNAAQALDLVERAYDRHPLREIIR